MATDPATAEPTPGGSTRDKPRLLVLTSTYPRWHDDTLPGFVHELCRRLADRGVAVDVLAPSCPGASRRERLDGVEVTRYRYFLHRFETLAYGGGILPGLRSNPFRIFLVPFFLAGMMWAMRGKLRSGPCDLVHAHWLIPQGVVAALAGRRHPRPLLVTLHGGDVFGLQSWPLPAVKSWILRRCRHVSVVSNFMKRVVCDGLGVHADNVSVMPMGVDLAGLFTPDPAVDRSGTAIVFVGRLVEKKGVRHLLDAFSAVHQKSPDTTLQVIGDGPLRAELENQAMSLGLADSLSFDGARSPQYVASAYRQAAVAVVPSVVDAAGDQEGLGLVTIEAMGCGCPVVASDLEAIRDVVIDGRTGWLARPGDAADLARNILRVLEDGERAAGIAAQARSYVVEKFDWSVTSGNYARLIRDLVGPGPIR